MNLIGTFHYFSIHVAARSPETSTSKGLSVAQLSWNECHSQARTKEKLPIIQRGAQDCKLCPLSFCTMVLCACSRDPFRVFEIFQERFGFISWALLVSQQVLNSLIHSRSCCTHVSKAAVCLNLQPSQLVALNLTFMLNIHESLLIKL